jgi:methylamine---glutamate N-methyltransferase subunit A
MCGIVGLRLKNPSLEPRLGRLVVPMLDVLSSRGPDSTGVAVYVREEPDGVVKYSLCAPGDGYDWERLAVQLGEQIGEPVGIRTRSRDAVASSKAPAQVFLDALRRLDGTVKVFGHGDAIEVLKDVGPALEVCERYGVAEMSGYQAIGHTRMATESAVTIEHSHPFAPAADLALVHNGSFSNYASVRRGLLDEGVRFDTDNDSEVAARFIASRLDEGDDLAQALRRVLKIFDGFFTLLVATKDEIAVVRDSFACKPMVVAETDDYVAMASEYVALAELPDIEKARVFEPMPEEIHSWEQ